MRNNNVEIVKAYTFEWDPEEGWFYTNKKGRGVVIYTSDKKVQFVKISGPDPHLLQVGEMIAQTINRTNRFHCYSTNGRIWPFKINERIGQSGCRDLYLDLYRKAEGGSSYIRKCNAASLHISMYGKVSDFSMYIGDAIELLIVAIAGHDWAYKPGRKTKIGGMGVRFVRPYRNEIIGADDLDYSPN